MYQVHKNGVPADNNSYENLSAACAECVQTTDGRYVVEVDIFDKVIRRVTLEECQKRADKFLHPLDN